MTRRGASASARRRGCWNSGRLPSIRDGLHFPTIDLQWVVNAYTIGFAGFLMLGGRLADLLGRRRVFLVGTALFALSSLGCVLADSQGAPLGGEGVLAAGDTLRVCILFPAPAVEVTLTDASGAVVGHQALSDVAACV